MSYEEENNYLVFCTKNGLVKRTELKEFENIRANGKIAISLRENDELIAAQKTTGENEILIASSDGRMIRFVETELRVMGRTASGVKGIDVGNGKCVGCEIAKDDQKILVVTENGYGKKTNLDEYRKEMEGIYTTSVSEATLDEAPMAYKSLDDIIDVIRDSVTIIDVMKPIYNFKAN